MSTSEESAPSAVEGATARIRLHVGGDWTATDLERLLGAVRRIYDAGLVAYLAREEAEEPFLRKPEELEQQAVRVELEPIGFAEPGRLTLEGSSHEVADAVSAAIQRVSPPVRSPRLFPSLAASTAGDTLRLRLLQEDALALAPEAQLGIAAISMESPGVIDLRGLGEPIKELGKLIERLLKVPGTLKDRKLNREAKAQANRTKEQLDEVEIAERRMDAIERYLRLQRDPDFRSLPVATEQIREVLGGVRIIDQLAESGHLLPAPEGS